MKKKLGEYLLESGLIDEQQLNYALKSQRQLGGTLGEAVIRLGYATEDQVLSALSRQMSIPHVNLCKMTVSEEVLNVLSFSFTREKRVLAIGYDENKLVIGMVDPTNLDLLSEIEFKTGKATKPVIITSHQFSEVMKFFNENGYGTVPLKLKEEVCGTEVFENSLGSLLATLVEMKGQDLHLSAGAIPSIRIDNEVVRLNLPALPPSEVEKLIFTILSEEQKKTFNTTFELDFAYSLEGTGRFRCNLYKQRSSVAFTARHVVEDIPSMGELGLPDFIAEYPLKMSGLILIAAPNGHGKSTTLACLVDLINRERRANIITIEDPIEFTHTHKNSNVNQREVGTDTKSFSDGLKHIFRQNPDVIIIGELRDYESISIALTASETGHLVMGTLHANSAVAAIDRILDIFPPGAQQQVRAQLADCLLLVFSQRLVRGREGSGRVLAWEKMASSVRVRNAIREGKSQMIRSLMHTNLEELVSIDWTLADLVASERVKYEEAIKYVDNMGYFNELLKLRGVYK